MFEELELPGIGKKYIVRTAEWEINIIVQDTGNKQIYFNRDDEIFFEVTLTPDEAKKIGLILTEAIYQTVSKDKIEYIQKRLIFEWIKIPDNSIFVGKSISDLEIRKKTGVSVVAVYRNNELLPNPDPYDFKFFPNDVIVCIGNRNQLVLLEKYVKEV